MKITKHILAISGSTRKDSSNTRLIKAIEILAQHRFSFTIFNGIDSLPHFNPDADTEPAPVEVARFRQSIAAADGIFICTPEYAHGVPGSLKNAIDWTVSSGSFSYKPTLLITASTGGQYGHAALLATLRVIEAKGVDELQLLISFIKTKLGTGDTITDTKTLAGINELFEKFYQVITAAQEAATPAT